MSEKRFADDLTEEEIRSLLTGRLRSASQKRLARFRQTGRLVVLIPDVDPASQGSLMESVCVPDEQGNFTREKKLPVRRRLTRFLSFAEILVIASIMVFFGSSYGLLNTLNRKSAKGFVLPTLTPTPLIRAIVLPSGHTPPTSPGGTKPNDAEIPEHLRPLVQAQMNIPIPTRGVEQGNRIRIPALDVDAPIVQGDGWEQLKKGVAQHIDTANPGQNGNMVLTGHNDVFGEVFRYLDRLKPGDEVIIYTSKRSYTYLVTGWIIVEPSQVEVMAPTPDATVTLISCYPYLVDNKRIVVKARLKTS